MIFSLFLVFNNFQIFTKISNDFYGTFFLRKFEFFHKNISFENLKVSSPQFRFFRIFFTRLSDSSLSSIEEILPETSEICAKSEKMISPHFEHLINYDFTDFYPVDDSGTFASYLTLQHQLADYDRQFNPYGYAEPIHQIQPTCQAKPGKIKKKRGNYEIGNKENFENLENDFPKNWKQDEFVMCVKRQRIRLGFTQADVGISLGALYNKHFSQTTVCRLVKKLTLRARGC